MKAVVLTLSGKNKGLCVVVYYPPRNQLFRLVSTEDGGEMPFNFFDAVELLDMVEVSIIKSVPLRPQVENILVDMSVPLKKLGRYSKSITEIYNLLYPHKSEESKVFGNNNCCLKNVDGLLHSIELCRVFNLVIHRKLTDSDSHKEKVNFIYNGFENKSYSLTDYRYDVRNDDRFDCFGIRDAILVISISSKPYSGDDGTEVGYFKFVSAVYKL